jgi:hypothetical protein
VAHQTTIPGTPRANLRLARGTGTASQNSPPRSRAWRPLNVSPPRSRALASRASFRLAREFRPLEQVSASLEAFLRPRRPACFRDRGIKCSDTPWTPGSKTNPRHANLLTQPGNLIPTRFEQPALYSHPRRCAGAVWDGWCHSMALYRPLPPFLHAALLERDCDAIERRTTPTRRPPRTTL